MEISEGPNDERASTPEHLSRQALLEIVALVQKLLYVSSPSYEHAFWNENKQFGPVELDALDDMMKKHGIAPHK